MHPAHASDNVGGQALLERLGDRFPRLTQLWTDMGYKKSFTEWVVARLGWTVACVKPPRAPTGEYAQLVQDFLGEEAYQQRYPDGFVLLPRRWMVERTLAWFSHQRRLTWKRLATLKC